jgi:hypothetical protein
MLLASFEQISDWFVKSLWAILKEHATLLTTIWAAAAIACVIFLIRRLLPKANPGITEVQVRIDPCDLHSFRFYKGNCIIVNSGCKGCNLTGVQLLHESLNFETNYVIDESKRDLTGQDEGKIDEQLPLPINKNKKKRIFFTGSHEVETLEKLPQTLSLEVTFDCRKKPLLYSMVRKLNTKKYVLHQP